MSDNLYGLFTMVAIREREWKKLLRQGIEMAPLQEKALAERAISMAIAKHAANELLQRLTQPQQNL